MAGEQVVKMMDNRDTGEISFTNYLEWWEIFFIVVACIPVMFACITGAQFCGGGRRPQRGKP